jgi:hypothetical protein
MARPWPLFALVIAVWCCLRVRREPGDVRWASALAFAVFALAMTAKILLATRIAHYGFALAMPATALLVAVGFDGVGRFVDSRGGDVVAWRSAFAIALVAFVVPHVAATARARAGKVVEVGNGADRFLADARGTVLRDVLVALARRPPGTLVVVPEGVMVDYLARAKNPTPFVNFMPPELALFGEAVMLEALRTKPPDRILVTHKSTAEYGVPWFGRDYAPALAVWIDAEYQAVELFGDPPLRPESRFGAALLERRAASARVPSTRQGRTLRTEGRATPRAPEGSPALGSL